MGNTHLKSVAEMPITNQALVTPGVVLADALARTSSWLGRAGAFMPTLTRSGWLIAGSGITMAEATALGEP